ncbi:MAG TPA: serine/threonine protein kinase [Burkholderiales bacterium]|jgi:Ser/Thr protein kinase RdoA (MazF antagonist)|nr:serine/threonine protein kinase [Burkholderiales bacterium]
MSAYDALTPELILDAIESAGYRCDGRLLALNSYENRVYQAWLDEGSMLVAKFYRPARWSDAAILEEHAYALELAAGELPVVAPLERGGATLLEHGGYRFALYERRPGRTPELEDEETLRWLGRFIARIHAYGRLRPFRHRPAIDIASFGREPLRFVLDHDFVPAELRVTYQSVVEDVLDRVERAYERAGRVRAIRLHGDCHSGNILWTDGGPHFVDLDDARNGPAVQDIWMWLSGDRSSMQSQLNAVMQGYREFNDFNPAELWLIEALRTLRLIHYSGWLAQRWDDPAFPSSFPFFNTQRYWQDQILTLREQAAVLDEPPLELY